MQIATAPRIPTRRGRITAFVDRHAVAWELSMAGLTLAYVALSLLADEGTSQMFGGIVVILAIVFFIEFTIRFIDAASRLEYLRGHWIDLVTCLPPVGPLRLLRLLRLVGLLRLAHQVRNLAYVEAGRGTLAKASATWVVWPSVLLLWLGAAQGFWMVERGQNPAVQNFGDALYLAFITVTTVGYGDVRPMTPEGRVIAGALVFLGLGLLGFISAQLTARWLRTEHKENEIEVRLDELIGEIHGLRKIVTEQHGKAIEPGSNEAWTVAEPKHPD